MAMPETIKCITNILFTRGRSAFPDALKQTAPVTTSPNAFGGHHLGELWDGNSLSALLPQHGSALSQSNALGWQTRTSMLTWGHKAQCSEVGGTRLWEGSTSHLACPQPHTGTDPAVLEPPQGGRGHGWDRGWGFASSLFCSSPAPASPVQHRRPEGEGAAACAGKRVPNHTQNKCL